MVFHCHNRLLQRSGIVIAGQSLRLSRAHVIACCKYAAQPLQAYIEPKHLSVLYNGVGRPLSYAARPRRRIRRIGVIGRVEPEKGQIEFIRAAAAVAKRFPESHFVVAGAPLFSNRRYFDEIVRESSGLPVEFLGWRDDIESVLASLDLLVVPSSPLDSAPRVIFEAFSSRVPVVAFPCGGIPEIVRDGDTGFLTSGTGPDALAHRICSVIEMMPSRVAAVVNRAWKRWDEEHTVDIYRERVGRLLMNAAGRCA